jgi:hypothetical protein
MSWNMGVQPLHPTLMNAEQNDKKWTRNCFVRRELRSLGIPFFEISSRGPGWVASKDEGAQSKCETGAAGQCQDLGRLADHASSAVGSTEDEFLRLALIKLNSAARYRQDRRRRWSKKTCNGSSHEGESFGCKLLGVAVTVAGVSSNALVENGCGGELLISRALASRVGIE